MKVEDWGESRWEFTKNKSRWHFDTTRPPEHGKDSYTYVCNFKADFTDAIKACMPRTKSSTWGSRNPNIERIYSADAEENDLIRVGADPKAPVFERAEAQDIELFQKINTFLGLEESTIKFHNQTTGQMLHTHMDNFAGRPERENSFKVTDFDENPDIIRRFAIMLDDWKLGQIFQLGNANFTQWAAGDCITWEWRDMPHSTANMGWWDRPMLQITGYTTPRTYEVMNLNHLVVKL
ncbi:hypothetical protein UFOVP247_117 [uncultured Caudovirales phage]|uniref:Uncharacterized protein n=1 Tax=uncultured Caudovirales phage TaxID=2100421 RepID=A0A6J7WYT7_9CAUD|nr:hypothetical protein UFOVP247_117 [uncultured Caudovirales phage]